MSVRDEVMQASELYAASYAQLLRPAERKVQELEGGSGDGGIAGGF